MWTGLGGRGGRARCSFHSSAMMQRSMLNNTKQFKSLINTPLTRKFAASALPEEIAQLYQEQERIQMERSKIDKQLGDLSISIPQALQATADALMGSLHEGALRNVLDCVIIRCAQKIPFGVDDVVQDLANPITQQVPKDLRTFLKNKMGEMFEEDGFQQVQEICQQLSMDQAAEVEDLNQFLSAREQQLSEILKTKTGRQSLKERKIKLEKLMQNSIQRLQKINEATQNFSGTESNYSAAFDRSLEVLVNFFKEMNQASRLEVFPLETAIDQESAGRFLAQLQKARNYLLVIFGINFGIVDSQEEQRQILKAAEQFQKYSDMLIQPLEQMLQEFSGLILDNLPKLDKERSQAIKELGDKIAQFEKTLNDQIIFCKERMALISKNEQRIDDLVKKAQQLKSKQRQLKKINYELKIIKETIETIDGSDGEDMLQEQQDYEREKLQIQKIVQDDVSKVEDVFVQLAQTFDGLSQCELLEMIMESSIVKGTEESVGIFKMISDE